MFPSLVGSCAFDEYTLYSFYPYILLIFLVVLLYE